MIVAPSEMHEMTADGRRNDFRAIPDWKLNEPDHECRPIWGFLRVHGDLCLVPAPAVVYCSRETPAPLRVKMAHTCSIASKALVAVLLCTGIFSDAFAAEPLPGYDPGQYGTRLDAPKGMPPVGLAAPAKPAGPAPNAGDPGIAGNLNLSMPDVTFRNLLTRLQAPARTADPLGQNSTPDTTTSYSASQPPPGPAQHDLATPTKLP